ncbi:MAG: UDP-N-acetylmuramoyl-L-alanyl-D-glutamate--2,6-diaminopimelate ligase [Alphaproteobacteria bacterium]|nr:UDP-N-acetylmuramoyl-L-alanyl-D-glutamate--2,6-diaminopimelate ligase [Alphaproteobacteria bacterium]
MSVDAPLFDVSALTGVTQDSRAVQPGYLFAALPGVKSDGSAYIAQAIAAGAVAVLGGPGTCLPEGASKNVALITRDNPRRAFAQIVADFYHAQPEHVVAITGTNGKTSTALFTQQLWEGAGYRAASLGTLGILGAEDVQKKSFSMTTPDPVALHAALADLAAGGTTHLAMEASSHGLDQCRLDGVRIGAAGFTNLSRDHLDYHADMQAYLEAKARLFTALVPPGGAAVLNADIPEFSMLDMLCAKRGLRVISYGLAGRDIQWQGTKLSESGQDIELEIMGRSYSVAFPLVGAFQVMNALCALGLVIAGDAARTEEYIGALANLEGVPGRLQKVPGTSQGMGVYVDYAHTPDALENILKALRPHTAGRLICVFGCGGDRDKGKRPVMGRIASDLADIVMVTDDNPRSETPETIRAEIMGGVDSNAIEIGDRRRAIAEGVNELKPGDVLVIAGKGHEQGQIFKDRTDPFDDVTEAAQALKDKT